MATIHLHNRVGRLGTEVPESDFARLCLNPSSARVAFGRCISCSAAVVAGRRSFRADRLPKEARLHSKPPPVPRELGLNEKLDQKGHLRSSRAARELALCILYAAYVSGVHPLQVFEARLKQRLAVRRSFDKSLLQSFSHSPENFGDNEPAEDEEALAALEREQELESDREAEILSVPIQIVYNKFVISLAKRLIEAAADHWREREVILTELIPLGWQSDYRAVALPVCILHLAIAELEILSTGPKIVVNEAVDLTKRFCDGVAPRVVNGCLGTYIRRRHLEGPQEKKELSKRPLKQLAAQQMQPEELGWNGDYRD